MDGGSGGRCWNEVVERGNGRGRWKEVLEGGGGGR